MKLDDRKRERYSLTGCILVYNARGPVEFEVKEKLVRGDSNRP